MSQMEVDLCHAWVKDGLMQSDVLMKVRQLIDKENTPALPEDAEHLTGMIYLLYQNYHKRYDPQKFLTAIIDDSFSRVMDIADNVNLRGLMIIRKYLHNYAPTDWMRRRV